MRALLSLIRGSLAFLGYTFNTLFWFVPILLLGLVKLLPIPALRKFLSHLIDGCASGWISVNSFNQNLLHPVRIEVQGNAELSRDEWYMVIANHQSWVDILVLQRVFNRKIPFLKFFLKQELLYVPILGLAWWALDFPFMRRYSTAELKKNPKLKGKDIEITRRACAKFKDKPVSVMNFVEGTRFQAAKHKKQNSPFQHLLRPKAGGMAFALSAMGEQIHKLVDVAIYYPGKVPSFWDFISGQVDEIRVHVTVADIATEMRGDYINDREFKQDFQEQLNQIWVHKDGILAQLSGEEEIKTEVSEQHA